MNFKQAIGVMLMFIMMIVAVALFGGISSKEVKPTNAAVINVSESPEISEYHYNTFKEQVTVDVGMIGLMIALIGITSMGGIANAGRD